MEEKLQPSGGYHQYDRVWQRVAPDLEPYPGWRDAPSQQPQPTPPAQPQPDPVPPAVQPPTVLPPYQPPTGQPGAIQNPCCMGTEAMDMLTVLAGFIEEELIDRRYFQVLSRQAPAWARQGLREMSDHAGEHARRLLSACYLINGQCYRPNGTCGPMYIDGWCQALRERYHTEACSGLNYARAAEGTSDPCLRQLLLELSREEYHHAEILMGMLQKSL